MIMRLFYGGRASILEARFGSEDVLMAKGEKHSTREAKKPKKVKPKEIAANASLKGSLNISSTKPKK
jgi:hypothetical protein